MDQNTRDVNKSFQVQPIGQIIRTNNQVQLEIYEQFRAGLSQLDAFSHVMVFWWADRHDNAEQRQILQTTLPYAPDVQAGVFACRSEYRPNPIAFTTCPLQSVNPDDGILQISNIDAESGTFILDLKPYIPVCDRVKSVRSAPWFSDWPQWMPETGLALEH